MKVVIITNIIAPYSIPVFNALKSNQFNQIKVIFLAENDKNRKWKIYKNEIRFHYRVLRNVGFFIRKYDMPIYLHWGLWSELRRYRPDVVCICGYHYFASLEAIGYARFYKKKAVLWTGSHLLSGNFSNTFTEWYKRKVITSFDSYLTYGTAAKKQIIYYGANPSKIVVSCNTVDIKNYMQEALKYRDSMDSLLLNKFPELSILYVGDLIPRKGVINLIRAFEKIKNLVDNVGLIIVGDGPEKNNLTAYVKRHKIKNVFFEGFVHKEEIIKYYVIADVFVLPSFKEVWGLVVNEAMACGMPIVCSNCAGVAQDLVLNNKNGFTYNPNNLDELASKLIQILKKEKMRKRMGMESLKLISHCDAVDYANSMLESIELSLCKMN